MGFCYNCGTRLSEQVMVCSNCGSDILIPCTRCNSMHSKKDAFCSKCGCPTNSLVNQQVYCTDDDYKVKKKSKVASILVSIIIWTLIGIGGFYLYKKVSENMYMDDYVATANIIIDGNNKAVSMCELIGKVWSNTIYYVDSEETDKYTKDENGVFYEDINDAIDALFSSSEFISESKELDKIYSAAKINMKKMKDYPSSCESEYYDLKLFYEYFEDMCDLAFAPEGDIISYNAEVNTLYSMSKSAYRDVIHNIE